MTEDLATRYGRTRTRSIRERWWLLAGAVAVVILFFAWAAWAGWIPTGSAPALTTSSGASSIVNKRTATLSISINTDPGNTVSCALESLDSSYAIVGWKIVTYPHVAARNTSHTETIRTTQLSTTSLISECWLT